MSNQENSYLKIKKLIVKSIKEGSEKKEDNLNSSFYWFRYFNYKENPLSFFNSIEQFSEDLSGLFVNREAEIQIISNLFGMYKKIPYNSHIAIIGPKGIGKHTTIKLITNTIKEVFPKIKFEFYNLIDKYDFKNNKSLSEIKMNEYDNSKLDIRIISCIGKNKWVILKRIKKFKENTTLLFSIWDTREFLLKEDLFINKKINF